jgi:hypothetical protein
VPRPVAWFLRAIAIVPLLFLASYALVASFDDPARFGVRPFIVVAGLFAVMIWELTKARGSHPSPDDADT